MFQTLVSFDRVKNKRSFVILLLILALTITGFKPAPNENSNSLLNQSHPFISGVNSSLGKANLVSPNGNLTPGLNHPTYTWDKVDAAAWYWLYVRGPSGFIFNQWYPASVCSGSTCSAIPPTSMPNGPYTWWVDTWNSTDGYGPWSDAMNFTVVPIPPPAKATLTTPSGNLTPGLNQPTYTWEKVDAASWYYLWVNGPSGYPFTQWYPASVCSGSTCSVTPSNPLANGPYTWWVETYGSAGYGPWSAGMTFTVVPIPPPAKATLTSPSGSLTPGLNQPTYTWEKVDAANWYWLYVSGPSGVMTQWYPASVCSGLTCSVTPATLLSNGPYTWWLLAWNSTGGYGPWSDPKNFTVVPVPPPGKSTLVSPSGSLTPGLTQPTYTWELVDTATEYNLYVNGPSGFVFNKWYQASSVCSGSTCSMTPPITLPFGIYAWKIQAYNSGGYGPWSDTMTFTIPAPGQATLVSPSGDLTPGLNQPTYTWDKVEAITWYWLYVSGPSGYVFTQWYPASVCGASTCSVTPSTTLANGAYTWYILTYNPTGYGPWSAGMSFTVKPIPPPGKVTQVSPSGTIYGTNKPTYTWDKVDYTTWYYLYVGGPSGYVFTQWYPASVCGGSTCSVTPSASLANGSYHWWIQTWNPAGYGPWSLGMNFTVSPAVQIRWFVGLGIGTDPGQVPVEQQVADDFNATHTDIHLTLEVVDHGSAPTTLADEIASGNAPDIVGPVGINGSNAFYGEWLDLAPLITATGYDTSQFDPALVGMYQTEEGQVGLPFAVYPSAIYYIPDLFDNADLNYPPDSYGEQYQMPDDSWVDWNWDTVTQVAKLLTLDGSGKNATQTGFDKNNIVQYGFSFGWEGHPNYWGSFWQAGSLYKGTPGSYTAQFPDAWQDSWQWVYDGMWGDQPFIPDGSVNNNPDFGNNNVFASGKLAMLENPSWYMCCVGDLIDPSDTNGTFQFGAMPTYNGEVGGRIDADTFRIYHGTSHQNQAFEVLTYLIGDASNTLLDAYGTPMPARTADQAAFFTEKKLEFPFITQESWDVLQAGLDYPDVPSAEHWMPNFSAAWNSLQTLADLMTSDGSLYMGTEMAYLQADLEAIFNNQPLPIRPFIEASPGSHWIHGRNWPLGTEVTMTIDDPSNGVGVDYTDTATMVQAPWNPGDPNDIVADFAWPESIGLQNGSIISMTGAGVTKILTVTLFQVTTIDPDADTISGKASPDAYVHVCANVPDNCITRWVKADGSGDWTADYSGELDLQPGSTGWAAERERDEDNDQLWIDWQVPNPRIEASPGNDWVRAREWPLGAHLTMTIDDPSNGVGVDYTGHATMGPNPWNPGDPNDIMANFDLNNVYDLKPGAVITMTDGVTTRTYTAKSLQVTEFDTVAETVKGKGVPGDQLQVCASIPNNCITRWVTVDGSGDWTADYNVEGVSPDDPDKVDLQPGSNGWVADRDEYGNQTQFDWQVPNPHIEASPGNDWVRAREWPLGADMTMTIDDPSNGVGVDYTGHATMGPPPWNPGNTNPNDIVADFNLNNVYDLKPGDVITMTDGVTTRTYTAKLLLVTNLDTDVNTVKGKGVPGDQLQVCANALDRCIFRWVTVDGSGDWTADYNVEGVPPDDPDKFEIKPGSNGSVWDRDEDGNQTQFDWGLPLPNFSARFPENQVHGYEWPLGDTVTLSIDDPDNGVGEDYTDTQTVIVADWDPDQTFVLFDLGVFKLEPGQFVTMTDGVITKTHTVTNLTVTAFDPEADTVDGKAELGSQVDVFTNCDENGCTFRSVTTDEDGNWRADFSTPVEDSFDIRTGTIGEARQPDDDGDTTTVQWRVPMIRISYLKASAAVDWVHAYGWLDGTELTLEVDNPSNGIGVDYTTTTTTGQAPWDPTEPDIVGVFDLSVAYDLLPGDGLTVTGGSITETYTVPDEMTQVRWFIGLGTGGDPGQVEVQQSVVDDFNTTHPDIELVLEIEPNGSAHDTLAAQFASSTGPDIVGPAGWKNSEEFHGQWLDLAPLIASSSFDTSQFDPALVTMYQTDEGQVGLPFTVYPSVIYYNPVLFTEAGLNPPPDSYAEQYQMPDASMVDWSWETVAMIGKLLTLDGSGLNATEPGFDEDNIVQYGFSFGWENHPNYWGSFWQADSLLQGSIGSYTAQVPDAWQDAWQWVYDGMWGDQPYIPNGAAYASLNEGNVLSTGQVAMVDIPSWYLCCLDDFVNGGGTFQFGAMPTYNGVVGGRIDADTFRIWEGSANPDETFEVLTYLVTTGVDKLIIGDLDTPPAYGGAVPALIAAQDSYLANAAAQHPDLTQASWDVMMAGLALPDVPSAEGWMPNITEAWDRIQSFGDLLSNNSGLNLDDSIASLEADLTVIFNP